MIERAEVVITTPKNVVVRIKDNSYLNLDDNLALAIKTIKETLLAEENPQIEISIMYKEQCNIELSKEMLLMLSKAGYPIILSCWESKLP